MSYRRHSIGSGTDYVFKLIEIDKLSSFNGHPKTLLESYGCGGVLTTMKLCKGDGANQSCLYFATLRFAKRTVFLQALRYHHKDREAKRAQEGRRTPTHCNPCVRSIEKR